MSNPMRLAPNFEGWMREVDRRLEEKLGLTHEDLPDICYRDLFDDGASPRTAAAEAIRRAAE